MRRRLKACSIFGVKEYKLHELYKEYLKCERKTILATTIAIKKYIEDKNIKNNYVLIFGYFLGRAVEANEYLHVNNVKELNKTVTK